jgi:hypothetical protein
VPVRPPAKVEPVASMETSKSVMLPNAAMLIDPPERPLAEIEFELRLSAVPNWIVPAGTAMIIEPPCELPVAEFAVSDDEFGRWKIEGVAIIMRPPESPDTLTERTLFRLEKLFAKVTE